MKKLTSDMLRRLAASQEFQKQLNEDRELDRLEALQYNIRDEYTALMENLGLARPVGSLPAGPVTPACWCMLCASENPYACGGKVRPHDMDQFLYLLARGVRDLPSGAASLAEKAAGFLALTGLTPGAAHIFLTERVRTAFLPLKLLPPATENGGEAQEHFDADWLNRVCAQAARRTMTPIGEVIHGMSMNQVCWQYVGFLREHDRDHRIRRRPESETARKIMERVYELGRSFLKEQAAPSVKVKD